MPRKQKAETGQVVPQSNLTIDNTSVPGVVAYTINRQVPEGILRLRVEDMTALVQSDRKNLAETLGAFVINVDLIKTEAAEPVQERKKPGPKRGYKRGPGKKRSGI